MLQGGVFDGNQLAPAASNGKELVSAPPVVIGYVPKEMNRDGEEVIKRVTGLMIPVYHSLNREKMLVEVRGPSKRGRSNTRRGNHTVYSNYTRCVA